MAVKIRKTKNMNLIHLLDSQIFDYAYDSPVSTEGAEWWVAFDGKKPVAFAGVKVTSEKLAFLCRSGVLPEYRGKRLQVRLLRARLSWARKRGLSQAITYTVPDNPPSGNSLIKCGFKLYLPEWKWAGSDVLYWFKKL